MKILCIGDSLPLPREECPYEATWFYKLQKSFPQHDFIDFFTRGLLMKTAVYNYDVYYQYYNPDIVIIQSGICDCSPRFINNLKKPYRQIHIISKKMKIEDLFWKIVKRRGRKPNCVYTDIHSFEKLYRQLVEKFLESGAKKVIMVKIGHSAPSVIARNPYMNDNVDRYNEIIEEIHQLYVDRTQTVASLDQVDESYFVDGYHCNAKGMNAIYENLNGLLTEINE